MYTRQIYNGLDFLGDVGGLKDGLHFMGIVLMQIYALIVGNPLNRFLLGAIFKVNKSNSI